MGSWGRHGWPKKDEVMRLYKETDGSYIMLDVPAEAGYYSAIGNVLHGPEPSLGSCEVSIDYTYRERCTRVQWSELPKEWQIAFRYWLDDTKPESVRGFWLVGQQPEE
jgi:hypothetical protein